MTQLVRFHGYKPRGSQPEVNTGDKGTGDMPPSYCDTAPGYFNSKTEWSGTGPEAEFRFLQLLPYVSNRCNVGWVFPYEVSPPYSFTFDYGRTFNNNNPVTCPIVQFRRNRLDWEADRDSGPSGSTRQWSYASATDVLFQVSNTSQAILLTAGRSIVASSGASFPILTNRFRVEGKVIPGTPNPTITIRNYLTSSPTTLWFQMTTSAIPLSECIINCIEFGVNTDNYGSITAGGLQAPIMNIRDLQFWDEDKTPFGQYDQVAQHGQWAVWDGTTENPVTFEGTGNGLTSTINPPESTNKFYTYPEMGRAVEGAHYTKTITATPNDPFTGSVAVPYDIYVPTKPAPLHGWPVVFWAYSGFFVGGNKSEIDPQWVKDMIEAGYIVVSVGYRLAAFQTGVTIPDQIRDYKRVIYDVKQRTDVDVRDFWSTGYSAGGYLAISTHLTRDMADDGSLYHRDLRINGAIGPPDPVVNGSFTYAAPINLEYVVRHDILGVVIPFLGAVINIKNMFAVGFNQSQPFNFGGVPNLDTLVTPNSKPLAYVTGTGDVLVMSGPFAPEGQDGHRGYIQRAYAANGIPDRVYDYKVRSDHDEIDTNYDSYPQPPAKNRWNSQIIDWLKAQRAALGLIAV